MGRELEAQISFSFTRHVSRPRDRQKLWYMVMAMDCDYSDFFYRRIDVERWYAESGVWP